MATHSIDTSHSEIGFAARHMVFAKVRGQFTKWTATLSYDPADPTKSSVQADIDAASIDTRDAQRDGHLRSADFLDVEKHPKITFKSTRVERVSQRAFEVVGDLTIRGTTRPVTLDVEQTGAGKDPWGKQRTGFSATTTINRTDWGLQWNQVLEAGGVLVSEKIEIEIEVEVLQSADQPSAAAP